jgi:hypothetical protein
MPGRVTTFYSYKGGVGRTFLLANVAWLLARWGRRVLCLDWDLEAPGVDRYLAPDAPPRPGVLDLVCGMGGAGPAVDWRTLGLDVAGPWTGKGRLTLIRAGRKDDAYVHQVQHLDWAKMSKKGLAPALEEARAQWIAEYDHVLIDSRTGITDIGAICAAQLPDILALVFTATWQSLDGAMDVAARAKTARGKMPIDRGMFRVLPVPCRIHTGEEERLEVEWSERFATRLDPLMKPWRNSKVEASEYLTNLRVREQARWSFGEQMPVRTEPLDDHNRVSWAFANVAALIDQNLEDSERVVRNRHELLTKLAGAAGLGAPDGTEHTWDVFVSYPSRLREFAEAAVEQLGAINVRVFYDRFLTPGTSWVESLYNAREHSRMFLVLVSDEIGVWQADEIQHISRLNADAGAVVLPIFLTDTAMNTAPAFLAGLYGLVLSEEAGWSSIAAKIKRRLDANRIPHAK